MSRRAARAAAAGALLTLAGCAWSNPENRPVWNVFEARVVPADDGWFYAALPLTVPFGLLAIVADAVVAHPVQVVDDAFGDAAELWKEGRVDFANAYYTEMGFLLPRAAATPCAFLISFTGRVLFDIPPRRDPAEVAAEARERERRQQERVAAAQRKIERAFVAWLDGGCRGPAPSWSAEFGDRLEAPLERALAGDAATRRALHGAMLGAGRLEYGPYRAELGLRDPDPIVRYTAIQGWPQRAERPPEDLVRALVDDPVEGVRLAARERFGR